MSIKKKMMNNFIIRLAVNYLHEIEGKILPKIIPDEVAVKRYCKKKFGQEYSLENPRTFSDKTNWYKLNGRIDLMTKCADKVGVRDYIKEKGYEECLNDVYGVYSNVEDIDFSKLPDKYVIKAAHGTSMQIIVKNSEDINIKRDRKILKSWLRQDIYWRGREWVYKDVPHRLIIEKYLEDDCGELRDYKVFCFNGTPKFMQFDTGRYKKHYRNFYDLEWNLLSLYDHVGNNKTTQYDKPKNLDFMIKAATDLSQPFQFVRVDFYEVNGKPYIGEMTFFHDGGSSSFYPNEWNNIIGDYWKLIP